MSEKNKNQRNNNEGDSFAEGLKIRKAVLGEDYIEGAIKANSNQFSWKLQEIITKWAWNDNWNDDILSLKVRSLITLALMTALNRPTEFEIHLRGAINNGVTVEELSLFYYTPQCTVASLQRLIASTLHGIFLYL